MSRAEDQGKGQGKGVHGPRTRIHDRVHGRVHGPCLGPVHGRVTAVCVRVVYTCTRLAYTAALEVRAFHTLRLIADWTTRGCHRRLCMLSFRNKQVKRGSEFTWYAHLPQWVLRSSS